MLFRIEFADDLMMVMDENNDGRDAHVVAPGRAAVYAAKMKINEWKAQYPTVDTVRAKRELDRLVARM